MTDRRGIVFDLQRGALHDGPGIRTVVFLKGCPLRCLWCHNPESISPEIQPDLKTPGKFFGREMSAADVMATVEKDRPFFEASGGGMTLSGGEPMFQFDFTAALLSAARERGISTCLDTCGYAPAERYRSILPLTDWFLYDFKATGAADHERWTGVSSDLILKNLRMLDQNGARIILRCPLIAGLNDTDEHLQAIAALAREMPRLTVEILPYHNMGRDKWARSGRTDPLPAMKTASLEQKEIWRRRLAEAGCPAERLRAE